MSRAETVDELRLKVRAAGHTLATALCEYEDSPSPTRLRAVNEAALWQVWFYDLLSARLRAEQQIRERIAA